MPRPWAPHVLTIDPVVDVLARAVCSAANAPIDRRCTTLGCDRAIAETLGVTRRNVQRWKTEGLTIWDADRIATRLDAHPAQLWGPRRWDRAQHAHDALVALHEELSVA